MWFMEIWCSLRMILRSCIYVCLGYFWSAAISARDIELVYGTIRCASAIRHVRDPAELTKRNSKRFLVFITTDRDDVCR